jgi:hypothetical protein
VVSLFPRVGVAVRSPVAAVAEEVAMAARSSAAPPISLSASTRRGVRPAVLDILVNVYQTLVTIPPGGTSRCRRGEVVTSPT